MYTSLLRTISLAALAASLMLPINAQAHRAWILPAATVLSSDNAWVTVDAAISNDIFHTDYHAMDLSAIKIFNPKGKEVAMQNPSKGRYRSVFDVELTENGTYKIAAVNEGAFAMWEENGERKRWRGALAELSQAVPENAKQVQLTEIHRRLETFVTNGAPTTEALTLSKQGLELLPHTHPNDLFATETARFQLLIDGKPAANSSVEVIPGGMRYRDAQEAISTTADEEGYINITWPHAGMYWLNAIYEDNQAETQRAKRRASYTATFEVLPL
ncbi:MAG TPA: DUF4198 domain-containing protein [Alcanivoracaceae bacterium]|nr:DUF4198 domain-containing protein [Alcanivoracaceae bacterium]